MRARLPAGLDILRDRIRALEQGGRNTTGVLPFGVKDLDRHLPSGGLSLGAVHEIAGGGEEAVDGAAAALFAAGIAARRPGQVLWCVTRPDLFAPALRQAGLGPDRVIYVEAGDEPSLLACFEEGLRHPGLAAEDSGGLGLAVRRWRRASEAADFGQHTASATRWRISPAPSSPLPVPGVGRARWFVELIRCRGAEAADFTLEACDETGRLALPAELVRRSSATRTGGRRAAA